MNILKDLVVEMGDLCKLCTWRTDIESCDNHDGDLYVGCPGFSNAPCGDCKKTPCECNKFKHINSKNCWCYPHLDYEDPKTGNQVWIHNNLH